jgi:hypothetical protein
MTGGVVRLTEIKTPVILGEVKVKIHPHYFTPWDFQMMA